MYCKDMKLIRSASEQNTYFTYVCLINDIKPSILGSDAHRRLSLHLPDEENDEADEEEDHIKVERSKALHELVESHRNNEDENISQTLSQKYDTLTHKYNEIASPSGVTPGIKYEITFGEDINNISEVDEIDRDEFSENPNPRILKLTKMKWLTEEKENAPDSSSPSLSPASSLTSSQSSNESDTNLNHRLSLSDKFLSTIIRLDKEHNMFGLSNIAIVGSRASKRIKKDDDKAVFHQTAIVQICCANSCCRYRSNTDMPASLKCGRCKGCCFGSCNSVCLVPSGCGSCNDPPCGAAPSCTSCSKKCSSKLCCPPSKCVVDCNPCSYGLSMYIRKKYKEVPNPIEITPRSSCVLQKPFAARSCHHIPRCIPPSSCFPYLMPCFWPARPSAPCSEPGSCFHIPPCLPPRTRYVPCPPESCLKDLCISSLCSGHGPPDAQGKLAKGGAHPKGGAKK